MSAVFECRRCGRPPSECRCMLRASGPFSQCSRCGYAAGACRCKAAHHHVLHMPTPRHIGEAVAALATWALFALLALILMGGAK